VKKRRLKIFIDRLNNYDEMRYNSFLDYYPQLFNQLQLDLQNEIKENLINTNIDKTRYLDYVKSEVQKHLPYKNSKDFISKWVVTFKAETFTFPYTRIKEINMLLAYTLSIKDKDDIGFIKLSTDIKIDFFCHAAMIEKYKVLDFIDNLTSNSIKSYEEEDWFKFGVELAAGNLRKHYDVNSKGIFVINSEFSARTIAKELGMKSINNTISGTFNNYSKEGANSHRNIFNDPSKISRIKEYCDKNSVRIVPEFLNRLPKE